MAHDCIIVGGGLAGLQAAIQLGRYGHDVLVIDAADGRSTWCRCYHNILGWPNGIPGRRLRELGRQQAEQLGIAFRKGTITKAAADGNAFRLSDEAGKTYTAKCVLLATGVFDRMPLYEQWKDCLGKSVFVCPDCDGYEVRNERTVVFGSGQAGASMALTLTYFTDDLVYVNHEKQPLDEKAAAALKKHNIPMHESPVNRLFAANGAFSGATLENGTTIRARFAFSAFGGNTVRSHLAKQLGAALHTNEHIETDPRTKMTSVENVWAAGDVTVHSEQAVIAMGEGLQAAIWIHKKLS